VTRTLRLGTRGSRLALAQSRWVQARLHAQLGISIELVTISTAGDRFLNQPLHRIGGKGVFVKEIEDALIAGTIDCAVHSMKDVPADLAPGLVIAAIPEREDARDVLISRAGLGFGDLVSGSRVGTSSLRRMALLRGARHDLSVQDIRGNVDTRLRKLDAGDFDALVLAAAGLRRLGIQRSGVELLDPEDFVPAIGQGALAVETRQDATATLLAGLDHHASRVAVTAERSFLLRVGGSCRTPLAAHAQLNGNAIKMQAVIAHPDGSQILRGARQGAQGDASALGSDLADELLERGGREILRLLAESLDAR